MDRQDLKRLQSYRGFPALSLRVPTHRRMPEAQQDPTRLKNMIRRAEQALKEKNVESHLIQDYVQRLDQLHRNVDYRHLDRGLFVFVGQDLFETVMTPERVPEAVVVEDNFLTRDLVRMLNRQPRYHLLLLSEKATRWLTGWGSQLKESTNGLFPMQNDSAPDQPSEGFNRGVDPKRLANERLRVFLRKVADEVQSRRSRERLPLFVAGVDRLRAFFMEIAGADVVASEVESGLDHAGLHAIEAAAAPAREAWLAARRRQVLERYQSVRSTRRAATGLEEVGKAAAMGRVETLLLEDRFAVAGGFDRQTGEVRPGGGSIEADADGDVVDEVVETVIERGGEAFFYAADRLQGDGAPIGAILRF